MARYHRRVVICCEIANDVIRCSFIAHYFASWRNSIARVVLLYSRLFCSVPFRYALFYIIFSSLLLSSLLFYSILFYSILFYSIPLYSIIFHSIPFHYIIFYSILFYSIPNHDLFCSVLFSYIPIHAIPFHAIPFFVLLESIYCKLQYWHPRHSKGL